MSIKKKYIIAICKKDALFPQNWDEQNYFDEIDNFNIFFSGELLEEKLTKKFHEAIDYVVNNYGFGESFLPVFVFDESGELITVEGSSNIKRLKI